ncbi:hypothetical protein ACJX0J_016445, partial [Zea mays]
GQDWDIQSFIQNNIINYHHNCIKEDNHGYYALLIILHMKRHVNYLFHTSALAILGGGSGGGGGGGGGGFVIIGRPMYDKGILLLGLAILIELVPSKTSNSTHDCDRERWLNNAVGPEEHMQETTYIKRNTDIIYMYKHYSNAVNLDNWGHAVNLDNCLLKHLPRFHNRLKI